VQEKSFFIFRENFVEKNSFGEHMLFKPQGTIDVKGLCCQTAIENALKLTFKVISGPRYFFCQFLDCFLQYGDHF